MLTKRKSGTQVLWHPPKLLGGESALRGIARASVKFETNYVIFIAACEPVALKNV